MSPRTPPKSGWPKHWISCERCFSARGYLCRRRVWESRWPSAPRNRPRRRSSLPVRQGTSPPASPAAQLIAKKIIAAMMTTKIKFTAAVLLLALLVPMGAVAAFLVCREPSSQWEQAGTTPAIVAPTKANLEADPALASLSGDLESDLHKNQWRRGRTEISRRRTDHRGQQLHLFQLVLEGHRDHHRQYVDPSRAHRYP